MVAVLSAIGISLGVGSSTLAVLNFFVAIKDGKIDETERHFMGITYIVLRVAMTIILITLAILAYHGFTSSGTAYFTSFIITQFILVGVLYANATLMTLHIMPSTFGPAIQASSWYTLGITAAMFNAGANDLSIVTYLLIYLVVFFVAVMVINGVMSHLKKLREVNA